MCQVWAIPYPRKARQWGHMRMCFWETPPTPFDLTQMRCSSDLQLGQTGTARFGASSNSIPSNPKIGTGNSLVTGQSPHRTMRSRRLRASTLDRGREPVRKVERDHRNPPK